MRKLFKTIEQQFKQCADTDSKVKSMTDEQLVEMAQQHNQPSISELFLRHKSMVAQNYFSIQRIISTDDFEGEMLKVFTKAVKQFDYTGKAKFSTYLHTCLENEVVNIAKSYNAIKRSKYETSTFSCLQTTDEDGNVKEFEIEVEADFGDSEMRHILDGIELTDNERKYCEYMAKYGKAFDEDSGATDADFANQIGVSRQYVYKLKKSLKIKLVGLQMRY